MEGSMTPAKAEENIKKSVSQPKSFFDKKSLKKGLTALAAIVLLTIIVWVIRKIDETLIDGFNVGGFVVPFLSALVLFTIGLVFYQRVKKTDTLKYDFITVAAHRLRTPLSRLGWMIAGLKDEVKSEGGRSLLSDAEKTATELTNITNHLLTAAEAGESSLFYSYFPHEEDLGIIARQVIGMYAIGARKKNIEVLISVAPDLPKVNVDRDRIQEALGAFLENAILYTHPNGRIEVFVTLERKNIKVAVRDNGIGLSREELPYVYTKFFRTKGAVASDADRAGLGLAIAKDIVEQHRGSVGVDSSGRDKGSIFWFSIPTM